MLRRLSYWTAVLVTILFQSSQLVAYLPLSCTAFSTSSSSSSASSSSTANVLSPQHQPVGNVLILDHLNINHEKGRHDWLKAFYFDFLKCSVDPRKADNIKKGTKTLWANIGANQFHLPEGKPNAQVLDGVVTLAYPDLSTLRDRFDDNDSQIQRTLQGSMFDMKVDGNGDDDDDERLLVTDPWGTNFQIVQGIDSEERDQRGSQPGEEISEGLAMRDLTIYTPINSNMAGIGRFYDEILGAPVLEVNKETCIISTGPKQTLTFLQDPEGRSNIKHDDMRDDGVVSPDGYPTFLSNYGPHVSMYVADLPTCYKKAEELGVAYVNPRFKRRAYNLDEAIDDCMFRCLDIVDPQNKDDGPIVRLEHEVRSVVKRDGTKYKSCPFDEIPDCCK